MNIGINARFITHKISGVERAANNLLTNILLYDNNNRYYLYSPTFKVNPEWGKFDNLEIVYSNINYPNRVKLHYWEQKTLPRLVKEYHNDLLLNPINTAPLNLSIPSLLILHSVAFMALPQYYSRPFRLYYNYLIPRIAHRAAHILTPSRFSREEIIKRLQVKPDKISVISNGVEEAFFNPLPETSRDDYLLFVGSPSPLKGIETLFRAYRIYRQRAKPPLLKLVIAGTTGKNIKNSRADLKDIINYIEFKGYQNTSQLAQLYRGSKLFIFPSLYESFGLPPLEAMAAGTPVIASSSSAIPEILDNAAALVDPGNPEEIAARIELLLGNKMLYKDFQAKGLQRARQFSWEASAKKLLEIFKRFSDHKA